MTKLIVFFAIMRTHLIVCREGNKMRILSMLVNVLFCILITRVNDLIVAKNANSSFSASTGHLILILLCCALFLGVQFLRAFAKLRKATVSFVVSIFSFV
jgi:hypothetical protein